MGKCLNKPRKFRPNILTARECRNIVHEATINPSSSAWQLVEKMEKTSQKSVSLATVKRVLNQADLHGRVPKGKPFITELNRRKEARIRLNLLNIPIESWHMYYLVMKAK
uniref:HTH_Tnp_Tc3_2 domain-containing protein n=1 Tax=Rhodnius prolixus TaxID=13249 RepID=T1H9C1_RHOPR